MIFGVFVEAIRVVSSSGVLEETLCFDKLSRTIENPSAALRACPLEHSRLLDTNFLVPQKFTRSDIAFLRQINFLCIVSSSDVLEETLYREPFGTRVASRYIFNCVIT